MEANFVLKASDLTAEFADGLRKVSNNATLYIRVEFGNGSESSASGGSSTGNTSIGEAPKKRGRKPGSGSKAAASASASSAGNSEGPKRRGRKPGSTNKSSASAATSEGPKKRGRKPKNQNG